MAMLNNLKNNQSGLVSITVTMIFLSLITLITVSFAFLMRREQQQALDRQLSTQAFYAAESGVSDAIAKLNDGSIGDKSECDTSGFNNVLDSVGPIEYTCVLIDQSPTSLEYSSVGTENSTIARLSTSSPIASVRISWQGDNEAAKYGRLFAINDSFHLPTATFNTPNFGDSTADANLCTIFEVNDDSFANKTGILRTTITPITTVSRQALINNSQTLFMYPRCRDASSSDESIAYSTAPSGGQSRLINGNCHTGKTPRYCNVTITGLNHTLIYLRLKSIYQGSSVNITAYDSSGNQLELNQSQAVIDVTGRARDVLRRIQVRVSLEDRSQLDFPEFAVESMDSICKRLLVGPNGTQVTGSSGEPACQIN